MFVYDTHRVASAVGLLLLGVVAPSTAGRARRMDSRASNAGRGRVIILTPARVVGLVGEVVSGS